MNNLTQCAVAGCANDESRRIRGWCRAHYLRWWRTGDPGPADLPRYGLVTVCSAAGCDREHRTKGFCDMHYRRWRRGLSVTSRTFTTMPTPRQRDGYPAVHMRLASVRGRAKDHSCVECGGPAAQWAYQHNDPNFLLSPAGMPYSTNIFDCYAPMCRSCHNRLDADLDERMSRQED